MGTGLNKIRNRTNFNTHKNYKEFIKENPNSHISYEVFKKVINDSLLEIKNILLEEPNGFILPFDIGVISVKKFKQKDTYRVVNWKYYNETKKESPLLNLHTMGYMYKFSFFKNDFYSGIKLFKFHAHRVIKRDLAKILLSGNSPSFLDFKGHNFKKNLRLKSYLKVKQDGKNNGL